MELKNKSNKPKKILYIDLNGVLVNFDSGLKNIDKNILKKYDGDFDNIPDILFRMKPMFGAVEAFRKLSKKFNTYILSTASWENSLFWSDSVEWVKKYLGELAYKRLIITHHKELNKGDYLIDDRMKNGSEKFTGELILFGSERFPDWESVLKYLLK
jgi:5'(3')-deoxyribonucleotidase